MQMSKGLWGAVAGCAVAFATGAASADIIMSFGYTDLDGDFDAGTSTFTANAVADGSLQSAGDVTRQQFPNGTAEFDTGFMALATSADFTMSMTLSNITATGADVLAGDASFLITDADGDTISGSIVGEWIAGPLGFMYFNGFLSDVVLTDNGAQDGTFDGTSGGSFALDFSPSVEPFDGSIVNLSINESGLFFTESFSNASTLVSAQIVPAPATVALLGIGGLMMIRRRRLIG
ncbi:MAG: PEP-CTERM sorting domain-containing protein [Phycisphaerales bacterium]